MYQHTGTFYFILKESTGLKTNLNIKWLNLFRSVKYSLINIAY